MVSRGQDETLKRQVATRCGAAGMSVARDKLALAACELPLGVPSKRSIERHIIEMYDCLDG